MQPKCQKLHKEAQEERGMHLSFSASQTDASRAEESYTNGCILFSEASQKNMDASEQEQSFRQN
jgi:hypothetical protein